jgi:eukaryotic-like serine/threonine-protein kinase
MQPKFIGGRYRVQSAIGKGGMGTVWLCHDETLHRDVAVKQVGLLPGESVTDSARALREARSTAALSHRNVVTVFDVVEESDHIWLVMEHVPGRSLSEIIQQDGPLDPASVADIGAQVASGLAAAHAAGTMHRDVKPGNVLVREDGVAKISDFGIARRTGDPALTQSGFLTGTPSYFSPELARGADPGPATDVWALGATLYAAVEGHPPYQQRTNPVAVLHEISSADPAPARRAEFLEPALLRMMDRDPDSRWPMDDAAHVLRKIADTHQRERTLRETVPTPVPHAEPPPGPTSDAPPVPDASEDTAPQPRSTQPRSTQPRPTRTRPRRRLPRAVLLVAALLLAVGGVVFVFSYLGDGVQPSGSGDEKDPASKASSGSGSSGAESPTAAKERLVREYYSVAPGGTDEAWAMLGPDLKAQGREDYDGFWRTVESVDVSNVRARPGSNEVAVALTYHTTDGRVSTERKREGLIRDSDGGYLINSDVPAG